jgi:ParB family chromosome partitioning protein
MEHFSTLAKEFHRLSLLKTMDKSKIASQFSINRNTVTQYLNVFHKCPPSIHLDLDEKRLTLNHAKELASLSKKEDMLTLRDKILKEKLNVRETRKQVELLKNPLVKKKAKLKEEFIPLNSKADIYYIEAQLGGSLNTRVKITPTEIKINYFGNMDILQGIIQKIYKKSNSAVLSSGSQST